MLRATAFILSLAAAQGFSVYSNLDCRAPCAAPCAPVCASAPIPCASAPLTCAPAGGSNVAAITAVLNALKANGVIPGGLPGFPGLPGGLPGGLPAGLPAGAASNPLLLLQLLSPNSLLYLNLLNLIKVAVGGNGATPDLPLPTNGTLPLPTTGGTGSLINVDILNNHLGGLLGGGNGTAPPAAANAQLNAILLQLLGTLAATPEPGCLPAALPGCASPCLSAPVCC